jgi:UDP-glucose 4-epimerase
MFGLSQSSSRGRGGVRILVTGSSGYLGANLVKGLSLQDWVEKIVGVDLRAPKASCDKFTFIRRDVRDKLTHIIKDHELDTIAHLSYILPPLRDKGLMEDINRRGTTNVLRAALEGRVERILYTSSTTAYGFHPDNEVPLTEESPLRGNSDFTYAKNKREIEEEFKEFNRENPDISTTILRPCFVVGPGFDNPLARHLRKRVVMLPARGKEFQFVHERDLTEICLLCLKNRVSGIYNVTGEGTITFKEMVSMLGGRLVELPWPIIYPLNNMAWKLRLSFITEFPSPAMRLMVNPWLASSEKLKKETGYLFKYDTRSAFEDFVRFVKSPDQDHAN